MRKLFLILAAGSFAVLASSSTLHSCDHVKGTGDVVHRPLNLDEFHGIVVEGSMDVVLTQSAERSVTIEAQANIAELVTTTVKNGIWHIGTRESCSTTKPFIVHISSPRMDVVHVEGSGSVKGSGTFTADDVSVAIAGSGDVAMSVQASSIKVAVDGSGNVLLSGNCERLKVAIAGSGDVRTSELTTTDLTADIAGSGSVIAHANGRADVDIAGSGNVVLTTKPASINQRIAGSGTLRIAQ
ncbi:MAG: DUF2807 domain-containing protein [Flavobacteriales bacterium]|nr:DUF2807 domain-containing protein [Flavobacteriales bacterium]